MSKFSSTSLCNTSTEVKDNTSAIVERVNKDEIAAFVRDLRAMCDSWDGHCEYCPLGDIESWNCKGEMLSHNFDIESAVAAVESYREKKRGKPCPEAIDKALDIYTIKVMVERNAVAANLPVRTLAQGAMNTLRRFYSDLWVDATIRLLSAKRLISEDQKDTNGEAIDVYIIEIEIVRGACSADSYTAMCFAEEAKSELLYNHYEKAGRTALVNILSAKRFVLESHREDNEE